MFYVCIAQVNSICCECSFKIARASNKYINVMEEGDQFVIVAIQRPGLTIESPLHANDESKIPCDLYNKEDLQAFMEGVDHDSTAYVVLLKTNQFLMMEWSLLHEATDGFQSSHAVVLQLPVLWAGWSRVIPRKNGERAKVGENFTKVLEIKSKPDMPSLWIHEHLFHITELPVPISTLQFKPVEPPKIEFNPEEVYFAALEDDIDMELFAPTPKRWCADDYYQPPCDGIFSPITIDLSPSFSPDRDH